MQDRIEECLDIHNNPYVNPDKEYSKILTQVKQDCIAVVEGKKKPVDFFSEGTTHYPVAESLLQGYNQACEDIIKALSE